MTTERGSGSRRWRPVLLVAGVLVSSATVLDAQDPQSIPPCESYCSAEKPGTSVMEIRWPIAPAPLAPDERRARLSAQTLDVSVYEDGFERGLFATLPTLAPAGRFRPAARAGAPTATIPGVARLVLTDVRTSNEPPKGRHLRLAAPEATRGGAEAIVIRVEGVEAGLNYFWKPAEAAANAIPIMCQAATCPSDQKTAPARVKPPSPNP